MKMTRDIHDLVGGLLMSAAGLFFALYGREYNFGSADRMGPGYFPVVLGWLLFGLGLLLAIPAWWRQGSPIVLQWGNLFWSVASLLAFALLLYPLGVALAALAASLVALIATKMSLRTRLLVSLAVAALTTVIFPIGLRMTLPIWP